MGKITRQELSEELEVELDKIHQKWADVKLANGW